jgi:hypothetical protein
MWARALRLGLLVTLFLSIVIPSAAEIHFGGFLFGANYSHFSGPYYPYASYYDGFYGPYGYPSVTPLFYLQAEPSRGEVRLKAAKDSEVYINQAYAGIAKDLKAMYLDPGAYDLEVRSPGKEPVQKRVYVLSGKTVKLEF